VPGTALLLLGLWRRRFRPISYGDCVAMAISFPQPRYMPCAACGGAVERASEDKHVCEPSRLVDFQMFQLRDEIAGIDGELGNFLDTPRGRFEVWWAERERRRHRP
jgi:hypothetical protein